MGGDEVGEGEAEGEHHLDMENILKRKQGAKYLGGDDGSPEHRSRVSQLWGDCQQSCKFVEISFNCCMRVLMVLGWVFIPAET